MSRLWGERGERRFASRSTCSSDLCSCLAGEAGGHLPTNMIALARDHELVDIHVLAFN